MMKKAILAVALAGIFAVGMTGCSSQTPTTFKQTVGVINSQIKSFQKEIPKSDIVGHVDVGYISGKDGMKMGCEGGTLQNDGSAIFLKDSVDRKKLLSQIETNLKNDGWNVTHFNDTANKVKKVIAEKDGYEYWINQFNNLPSKNITGSTSGIQITAFGPCVLSKQS